MISVSLATVLTASLGIAAIAHADPVKTTEEVELRAKPGEKEKVVAKLAAGTIVIVDETSGRWLKVHAGAQSGYLTRTVVSGLPVDAGGATGAWSADRRGGGAAGGASGGAGGSGGARPDARALFVSVTAATPMRGAPQKDAAAIAQLAAGARLAVLDASAATWIKVRDDQGHDGWVARDAVDDGSAKVVRGASAGGGAAGAITDDAADDAPAFRAPVRGFALRATAGVGYRSLDMDFSSNGTTGLANYTVSADAPSLDVGVEAVARGRSRRTLFGVGARLRVADASPGIDYPGPTATPGKIPFSLFESDAWLRVGVRAGAAVELSLVAGAHYDAFVAHDVNNTGMLPRERLLGATGGARVELAPPRSRVSVTAAVDVLALGARKQTPGLEDGTSSVARALWGRVLLRYQLGPRWSLVGGVDYVRASTRWSGMSVRLPGTTSADRIDTSQIIQLGVGADL